MDDFINIIEIKAVSYGICLGILEGMFIGMSLKKNGLS